MHSLKEIKKRNLRFQNSALRHYFEILNYVRIFMTNDLQKQISVRVDK